MRDGVRVGISPGVRAALLLAAWIALGAAAVPGVHLALPPFAIGEGWALFADGPGEVRRLEVHVDGRVVSRTGDPAADWSAPAVRNRHVRPALTAWLTGERGPTARAAQAWVCERATRAFPAAERVDLVATYAAFEGGGRLGEPVVARSAPCRAPVPAGAGGEPPP